MATLTEKLSRFLPPSENEFGVGFVRELAGRILGEGVDRWQVDGALQSVVKGSTDVCPRDLLGEVVREVQRRVSLEKTLLWDMRFLNGTAESPLPLKNVLTLFKTYFGSSFGKNDWENFLRNREKDGPASFLELRRVFCNFVCSAPCTDENVEGVLEDLAREEEGKIAKLPEEGEAIKAERRERYRAQAKAWLGELKVAVRPAPINSEPFVRAITKKYQLLCRIAISDALQKDLGEEGWLVKTELEREELISTVEGKVQSLRALGRLLYCDHALQLKGLLQTKEGLPNLMGLNFLKAKTFTEKIIGHREKMFRAGRDESHVKETEIREYTLTKAKNEQSAQNSIHDLFQREEEELGLVELQLSGRLGRLWSTRERDVILALLHYHGYRACGEGGFRPAAVSVSLAEHVSALPEERLFEDYDRWYDLARYRVTRIIFEEEYDRYTGLPLTPQSLPPVLSLTSHQNSLRELLICQHRVHDAECVYLQLLLYSDLDEEDLIKLLSCSQYELEDTLAYLRQQRRDWRLRFDPGGESAQQSQAEQYELLKKAMFVKVLLVQYRHDLLEDADSAMVVVMSELVQIQEVEMALLVQKLPYMVDEEVSSLRKELQQFRAHDNVSHVLTQATSEYDDNALLEIIHRKYESLKTAWMRDIARRELNGGMSVRDMIIKERALYTAGELYDAKNIFGDCVVHPEGLHGLMGPNRELIEEQFTGKEGKMEEQWEREPSDNLLMDFQFRYKDDKAYLLTELKNAGLRSRMYEYALLQLQIFVLQEYSEFDIAASHVGLLEKIHLHPHYRISKNTAVLQRISEHLLCCRQGEKQQQQPSVNPALANHEVFLEGSYRQVLRKTMVYLVQRKHHAEQKLLAGLLSSGPLPSEGPAPVKETEKAKLRGIRQEMMSRQVSGAFLESLQQKQLGIFRRLLAHSELDPPSTMATLLACQMDEAATLIADMLTLGKLELSVLVNSYRRGITLGYHDNIVHILCALPSDQKCTQTVEGWFREILPRALREAGDAEGEVWRTLQAAEGGVEQCRQAVVERQLKVVPQSDRWGLLPSQLVPIIQTAEKERKLLQEDDNEMSEGDLSTRVQATFKEEVNRLYKDSDNMLLALSQFRSELPHLLSSELAPLYCCYGNLISSQQLVPAPVIHCYTAHLLRMMTPRPKSAAVEEFVLHRPSIIHAARAFLRAYNSEWAAKAPLGSRGMLSLVRDYSMIHYTIASYRKYILSCLHKHHAMELSLFCGLLLDSDNQMEEAMAQEERTREMLRLGEEWEKLQMELKSISVFNETSSEQRSSLHQAQRELMLTALSLKYGSVLKRIRYREKSTAVTVDDVRAELLGELVEVHLRDIKESIASLHEMTMLELASLKTTLHHNVKAGLVGSVAVVCFTPLILTRDEEVAQELEDKYERLKDKLYAEVLLKNLGEKEWALLSEKERQKKILEMRREAMKLKREGREDEVDKMFAEALANDSGMIELLGVSKEQYLKQLEERKRRRKEMRDRRAGEEGGEGAAAGEGEEKEDGGSFGILDTLNQNFESERDEIMRRLRESGDQFATEKERQAMMVKLRLQKKRLEEQGKFDEAALILGQARALGDRQMSEKERQLALARARIAARRRAGGKEIEAPTLDDIDLTSDDPVLLQEKLVELVHLRHEAEREVLQELVTTTSPEALSNTSELSRRERQLEIGLLREDRRKWREELERCVPDAESLAVRQKTQRGWLEQATLVHLANHLTTPSSIEYNDAIADEDVRRADYEERKREEALEILLMGLQEKQEDEEAIILGNIKHKGLGEVQGMCAKHKRSLLEGWLDNISAVLFAKQAAETEAEDEVVKELEKKYDTMKDRLILQMLEQQMGADEWNRLSERERQKKLVQMKLRDRQLRAAGREDEADEMYRAMVSVQKTKEEREEEGRKRMKERIKSRLEYKRQRQAEGASKEEIERELEDQKKKEEEMDAANMEVVSARDLLSRLTLDFDKEKDALLGQIRDSDGKLKDEKERQLALLRLKRQQIRLKKDADMDTAALLFSEAHAKDQRLEDARSRQLFLAKQRMAARRAQKKQEAEGVEDTEDTEDTEEALGELEDVSNNEDTSGALQDSIIQLQDKKHSRERDLLISLTDKITKFQLFSEEEVRRRGERSPEQLDESITELRRDRYRALKLMQASKDQDEEEEKVAEFRDLQENCLAEALLSRIFLSPGPASETEDGSSAPLVQQLEEGAVKILAMVQERQDVEGEATLARINHMDVGQLSEVRQVIHRETCAGLFSNLATVILGEVTESDMVVRSTSVRDKKMKERMAAKKEARKSRKQKKREDMERLMGDLNNETTKNLQEVTDQYEEYKTTLDRLLMKKDLTNLTSQEEELMGRIQELLAQIPATQEEGVDGEKTLVSTLTQDNKDELYRRLKQQHRSQLNQINAAREAQKRAMMAKLKLKTAIREKKDDEADTMQSMFGDFARSQTIVREKTMVHQSAAKERLAGILAKKKEAAEEAARRKRAKQEEEEEEERRRREGQPSRPGERFLAGSREGSRDTSREGTQVASREGSIRLLSREGSLSKIEASGQLGDDHKKELLNSLVRQATSAEVNVSRQRSKQAELLKARIRAKQMAASANTGGSVKLDRVQREADEILGAMERDKTQLQFAHSQELQRQKTIIRDRIRKMKERSSSAPLPPAPFNKRNSEMGFSSQLSEEERLLPKKEQMQLVAARRQDRLRGAAEEGSGATLAALADDEN